MIISEAEAHDDCLVAQRGFAGRLGNHLFVYYAWENGPQRVSGYGHK